MIFISMKLTFTTNLQRKWIGNGRVISVVWSCHWTGRSSSQIVFGQSSVRITDVCIWCFSCLLQIIMLQSCSTAYNMTLSQRVLWWCLLYWHCLMDVNKDSQSVKNWLQPSPFVLWVVQVVQCAKADTFSGPLAVVGRLFTFNTNCTQTQSIILYYH